MVVGLEERDGVKGHFTDIVSGTLGDRLPAHSPFHRHVPASGDDVFQVIAAALLEYQRHQSHGGTRPQQKSSHQLSMAVDLRTELAEWLRTPEGGRFPLRSAQCRPLTCGASGTSGTARFGPPDPVSSDGNAAAPARLVPVSVQPSRPSGEPLTVDEAANLLRAGGWTDAFEYLIPALLVRLPKQHALRLPSLVVEDDRARTVHTDGGVYRNSPAVQVLEGGRCRFRPYTAAPFSGTWTGPDAFLRAAFNGEEGVMASTTALRRELAAILQLNPEFTRLQLLLHAKRLPFDHVVLSNICMMANRLQLEGQQLLNTTSPQRDVTGEDLRRWIVSDWWDGDDRDRHILDEGVSLLHAKMLTTSLGLSKAGKLLAYGTTYNALEAPSVNRAVRGARLSRMILQDLPRMMYVHGSLQKFCLSAGKDHRSVSSGVPEEVMADSLAFADAAHQADSLLVPLPGQAVSGRSGPQP
ncbi:hypothetical protein OU995_11355 [Roseateles sp. SL47]|uniref:hypothetical protein n=1 Tax=Roseateles sp. SL47 TaxID=2995138 RepID=UPI0022712E0D|nr:hypothetical protein [Roseateles sp. SL47]WAC75252.1 hypothetical protein OU995_11355 [Roseateles sp. SL47]